MSKKEPIGPADYAEPRCLLCDEPFGKTPEVRPVPQQRIIQKMDDYMSRRDYAGAERHLFYWLEEAKLGHDLGGQLMLRNELVGHFRKTGNKDGAMESAGEALRLLAELEMEGTVSAGTTYINIATACNAFGEDERALELFHKARAAYESSHASPSLLGGLYNNMALTYAALGQFDEAFPLYEKALAEMAKVEGGDLEQAITYLNMADAYAAQRGEEAAEAKIEELLDTALDLLLNTKAPKDGYYAFVCEKCAPGFSYYGYFLAAKQLNDIAEAIYERD